MKAYTTFKEEEIKARFKPIKLNLAEWPTVPSVKKILEESETASGDTAYIVEMKDSQVVKVSKENLQNKYLKLIEQFHKEKQTSNDDDDDDDDDIVPKKRVRSAKRQTRSSKRIKKTDASKDQQSEDEIISESESESDQEYVNHVETESNSQSEDDFIDDSELETQRATTQRGRVSVKPVSYASEFSPTLRKEPKTVKVNHGHPLEISLYEDESFIAHHSEYCFKCHKTGRINGPKDDTTTVYFGGDNPRTRLLLCDNCSFAFHNNCISRRNSAYNGKSAKLSCQKCVINSKCSGCSKSTLKQNPVAFRCLKCFRAFHEGCIISGTSPAIRDKVDESLLPEIYTSGQCVECYTYKHRDVEKIMTDRQENGMLEYFVKWKGLSYGKAEWVSAEWISQVAATSNRSYLSKKENGEIMPYTEEWLKIDRIISVRWENKVQQKVKEVLAVFKDRDYVEACWDEPPSEEEPELYAEYQKALKRYIQSMNVEPPKNMRSLISQVRSKATSESYEKHELKSQPKFVTGGTLMKHQMEALNWLLYQWEHGESCILADDMGLGKTIQIITFLYYLFKKYKIYPFYIVVPNSTATNWIREFQKWAPEMTVAPFFGGSASMKLSLMNEIFDKNNRLKCHVVVTTYESAFDSALSGVFWPVMVVDESQRLKNDNSQLFKHLQKLRVDHTVLLTGTPMQNNLTELFNIMSFIHPEAFQGHQADDYAELTTAQVEELHSRLRPYFLRRTKEEVLKTLPPRYELIVPVTMSTLQKEVYKQCLSGEIQEILTQVTQAKRQAGLSSIFMNLRKVLNHPYLLDGVETKQPTQELVQKNMINASAKLKLFHAMLPKLIERGHRMLIFSTMTRTLDVLEDYFYHEGIKYARIDGSTIERDRVRRIDAFNAADSQLKVFLLSTRAGGVGINLATADTVIIWDSDFNPYADLQAIGRAHRIGQNKMVLIYRLMTRYSVEEKVLQIAKKRIALEHVVVERMKEKEDDDLEDIESILKYGTEALFSDDNSKDIVYDTAAIENLLDREQYRATATEQQQKEVEEMEDKANEKGAMNFSFAKVWKSDGTTEEMDLDSNEEQKDTDFWEQYLLEQQALLEKKKEEKRLAELNYGRGARKRANVQYNETGAAIPAQQGYMEKEVPVDQDDADNDFVAVEVSESESEEEDGNKNMDETMTELAGLGIQAQKENQGNPPPQQGHPREEVLQPLNVPQRNNADALFRMKQRRIAEEFKSYSDSLYGILLSCIDRDMRHIQEQLETRVAEGTFSPASFDSQTLSLANLIQKNIKQHVIETADNERHLSMQNGLDGMTANQVFEGKKLIISRSMDLTTQYVLYEFEKLKKYATVLLNRKEEERRVQLGELKAEIQRLQDIEKKFKKKFKEDEKKMKSEHKKQILMLANRFAIYPDGVPPNQSTDMDAAADRLIKHVLGTDQPNHEQPSTQHKGQPNVQHQPNQGPSMQYQHNQGRPSMQHQGQPNVQHYPNQGQFSMQNRGQPSTQLPNPVDTKQAFNFLSPNNGQQPSPLLNKMANGGKPKLAPTFQPNGLRYTNPQAMHNSQSSKNNGQPSMMNPNRPPVIPNSSSRIVNLVQPPNVNNAPPRAVTQSTPVNHNQSKTVDLTQPTSTNNQQPAKLSYPGTMEPGRTTESRSSAP